MNNIKYYKTYEDDFVKSAKQDLKLKSNFKWIHKNPIYKFGSFLCFLFFLLLSFIYSHLIVRVKIVNKKALKKEKGYFLYANHTNEIGDVLNPILISFPIHPYFICSPANFGIPIIGKILPMAGGLPISDNIHDLKNLKDAVIYYHNQNKNIIIYPEAHLWPYCTFIRSFGNTSFAFPVDSNAKTFVSTTTYQKRKNGKLKIVIYIDGPFTFDNNLSRKENMQKLHDDVYNIMVKRSKESTFKKIKYIRESDKDDKE